MAEERNFKNVEFSEPNEYFNEFKARFEKMKDEELVEAFNKEVGNPGWGSARASYLAALHREFVERGFDFSAIGNRGSISLKRKVKLAKKLVPIED